MKKFDFPPLEIQLELKKKKDLEEELFSMLLKKDIKADRTPTVDEMLELLGLGRGPTRTIFENEYNQSAVQTSTKKESIHHKLAKSDFIFSIQLVEKNLVRVEILKNRYSAELGHTDYTFTRFIRFFSTFISSIFMPRNLNLFRECMSQEIEEEIYKVISRYETENKENGNISSNRI